MTSASDYTDNETIPLLPTSLTSPLHSSDENSGNSSFATFLDTHDHILGEGEAGAPAATAVTRQYPIWIAVCFALNYSIGGGILGIPYEFYASGYVLATVLMCYVALLSYVTYCYVFEGLMRAEAITTLAAAQGYDRKLLFSSSPQTTIDALRGSTTATELQSMYKLSQCEYQLSQIIRLFCGKYWQFAYDVLYGLNIIANLWSYCALFSLSLTRNIGIFGVGEACDMETNPNDCHSLYLCYVSMFYVWIVFITLLNFVDQQWLQVFTTFARMFFVFLMVFVSITLIYSEIYYDGNDFQSSGSGSGSMYGNDVSAWKWTGILYMIAIASFAYGNQYCVTDIIKPMNHRQREYQHGLWGSTVGICTMIYIFCGIPLSLYFGSETESPCTLAFKNFIGFSLGASETPYWASFIAWFIVLFPAADIASSFPLNAITVCNTFEVKIFSEERLQSSAVYRVGIRVFCCTIVTVLALCVWNFTLILVISGILGLLATYGGPCVLEYYSQRMCDEIAGERNAYATKHSRRWISNHIMIAVCLLTCVGTAIGVSLDLMIEN